jgi:hypothetical protein
MTVAELAEKLASLPPDAPVWIEGCDCVGKADGVSLRDDADEGGYVLIERGAE